MAAPVYVGGVLLPSDDSLVLDDSDDGPLVVDRVGPVWQTLDDLLGLLPAVLRKGSSTLRDVWLQTWGAVVLQAQADAGFVLEAQASPRFADGLWLDSWANTLGHPRTPGEDDAALRARLMGNSDLVSPTAIKGIVNTVVAAANEPPVIYNEPAVDQAFCGPATTSDPVNINSEQQSIAVLQPWFAFVQPLVPLSGVGAINQTIYYGQNLRFWANYSGVTGNTDIGAFAAPLGPGFWVIVQNPVDDDALTPHSEPLAFSTGTGPSTIGLDPQDFVQGITGATTPHQSEVLGTPTNTSISYGYAPQAYDTIIDRFDSEIARHKAAGVPWVVMIDYPVQYTR